MNGGYKTYTYDAFGNETAPDADDTNPFRYCGEYYDRETGTYYLRARYYAPTIGRFTQQDTHWTNANRIYGDNPQKTNEREDRLGIQTYAYVPQISAVMQSGNLYVYCMNDPVMYVDESGEVTQKGTPPPPSSGYQPPKGKKPGDAWNKERKGWEDKNGNIWVPDRAGHGINRQNGDSDHWDVQNKDGTGYINVGADGNKWGGRGKAPKIPEKNNVSKTEIDIIPVIVTLLLMVTIAISLAAIPATGGTSLIILSIV